MGKQVKGKPIPATPRVRAQEKEKKKKKKNSAQVARRE